MKNMKTKGSPCDIDIEIGKNLRSIRKALDLSQEELAAKIDVTFQQVQKYERGTNRISAIRLCMIAQALKITPQEFLPSRFTQMVDHDMAVAISQQKRKDLIIDIKILLAKYK